MKRRRNDDMNGVKQGGQKGWMCVSHSQSHNHTQADRKEEPSIENIYQTILEIVLFPTLKIISGF